MPGRLARRDHRPRDGAGPGPGRRAGRLRRLRRRARLPGGPAARVPIVVHEANPRPGLANRLGARLTAHVVTGLPDTPLRTPSYIGIPLRREIATLDRLSTGDKARSLLRAARPTCRRCWSSAAPRAPRSLNEAAARPPPPRCARPGCRCCTSIGPKNTRRGGAAARRPAVRRRCRTSTGWTSPTPPPTSCCAGAGAMTCAELTAVGLPAAYVPLPHRQRRAAAQRRAGRRRPGAACWSTTPS